jgi:predicted DNA-binding transcriptional regulator AlpA
MELKMVNLAIGKLSDDIEKINEQIKEIFIQLSLLKIKKNEIEKPINVAQEENELLTLKEVRKILKMSRNSILKMIENKLINPIRLTDRTVRYVKSEIQTLLKSAE